MLIIIKMLIRIGGLVALANPPFPNSLPNITVNIPLIVQ